jgi:rubredoxin
MRHAANELNFQIEDNCPQSLELKNFLVKHLSMDDMRTFGICIGIKTRKKSEIFSSILIRKRYLVDLGRIKLIPVYDILRAKDFNPNERTDEIFSTGNPRAILPEQLRRVIYKFYEFRRMARVDNKAIKQINKVNKTAIELGNLYQCQKCFTIYNEETGEPESNILPQTPFVNLPKAYCCTVCEGNKDQFVKIDPSAIAYIK